MSEENVNEVTSAYFSLFSITKLEKSEETIKEIPKNKKLTLSEIRNSPLIDYDNIDFPALLANEKPLYAHPEKVSKNHHIIELLIIFLYIIII